MAYDLPNNITTMTSLIQWSNGILDGLLGIILLVAIFVVSFVTTSYKTESANAFTFAIILTTVMAILFRILEIVSSTVLFVCFVLAAFGIFVTSKERSGY